MARNPDWPYGPLTGPGPKPGTTPGVVTPPGPFAAPAGNPDPANNGSGGGGPVSVSSANRGAGSGGVSSGGSTGSFGYPSPTIASTPQPNVETPGDFTPPPRPTPTQPPGGGQPTYSPEELLNPETGNQVNPMWLSVTNTGSPDDANPGDAPTAAQMAKHPEWGQTWQANRKLYLQSMSRYTTYIEDQIARSNGSRQETLNALGIYPVHEHGLASWNKYSQELIDQIRAGYTQKHFDNQALLSMVGRYPAGQVPSQYPSVPPASGSQPQTTSASAPQIPGSNQNPSVSSFSIPGVTVPIGQPQNAQGQVASTSSPVTGQQQAGQQPTTGAQAAKGQVAAVGPTVWNRVPTGAELSMVPPGTTAETPVGTFSNASGQPMVTLNPAGYQAYQSAVAKLSQQFGFNPLGDISGAPAVPLEVGKHNFNPFTGQWITPQKRRTA